VGGINIICRNANFNDLAGSMTKEICEAAFRWETSESRTGFSVRLPHRKSQMVGVSKNLHDQPVSTPINHPYNGESRAFWRQLVNGQTTAFEAELFNEVSHRVVPRFQQTDAGSTNSFYRYHEKFLRVLI
jgi:hypothetical protein